MRAVCSFRAFVLAACAALALVAGPALGDAGSAAVQRAGEDEADGHVSLGGLGDAVAGRRLQTQTHHRASHVHDRRDKDRVRRSKDRSGSPRRGRKEGHRGSEGREGKKHEMKKRHHKEGKKEGKKEGEGSHAMKKRPHKKEGDKKEEGKRPHKKPHHGGPGASGMPGGYGGSPMRPPKEGGKKHPVKKHDKKEGGKKKHPMKKHDKKDHKKKRGPLYLLARFRRRFSKARHGYDLSTKRGAKRALRKFSKIVARGKALKRHLKTRGKWSRDANKTLAFARRIRRAARKASRAFV